MYCRIDGRSREVCSATTEDSWLILPLQITLPGGGGARICTKRDTFPDGTDFVGVGVIPDVEIHPTAADIAAGRDRVFEEGVATLKKMITR